MSKKTPKPKTPVVQATISRCPRCDSTERSRYTKVLDQAFAGFDADGRPYDTIARKWCTCLACGQSRVDRYLELRGVVVEQAST